MEAEDPEIGSVRRSFDWAQVFVLSVDPAGQHEFSGESLFERRMAFDLAANVADDSAKLGLQCFAGAFCPLELLGVCIALLLDQGELADPCIGLPQPDAPLPRKPHETFASPMHQPCIGWEGDGLRLHCRIDNDPCEVGRLGRATTGRC